MPSKLLQRCIDIFFELIAIDAVSLREKPVADYIRTFAASRGLSHWEDKAGEKAGGNTGNIIIPVIKKSNQKPFAFMAHMDTVKSTKGINAQIHNDKIITDGTTILGADNRIGIALILTLIDHIVMVPGDYHSFEAVFTIAEETSLSGSTHLDKQLVKSRTVYVLDSSADPRCYVTQSPESVEFKLSFLGKSSHAAVNPGNGINAISMAAELIHNTPCGQVDDSTTVNFGKVCGGDANNVIPPKIDIEGEVRSFDPEKNKLYMEKIEKMAARISEKYAGRYTLEQYMSFPSFKLDTAHPAIKLFDKACKAAGLEPKRLKYHGGSDANILNNRGFMAIDVGVGAKKPHSVDEYIELQDLSNILAVLRNIISC